MSPRSSRPPTPVSSDVIQAVKSVSGLKGHPRSNRSSGSVCRQLEGTGVVRHYFPGNLIVRDPDREADLPLHYPGHSTEDNTGGRRLAQPAVA